MSIIIAMSFYSFSMSISPGPVNMVTLSSSLNYGFKKVFPFVSGATIGFVLLLIILGISLSSLSDYFHSFYGILKYLGAGFIIYMGFKMMFSHSKIEMHEEKVPSFSQGALLQFLNPKAWMAAISGVSIFNADGSNYTLILFVTIYFLICYISMSAWALLGTKLKKIIKSERLMKLVNTLMGISLISIALYMALAH